jgi:hypothetical protein
MGRNKQTLIGLILTAVMLLVALSVSAQGQPQQGPARRQEIGARRVPAPAGRGQRQQRRREAERRGKEAGRDLPRPRQQQGPLARGGAGVPPQLWERIKDLPPGEREKVIVNDERFRRMPPERQAEILERFRRFNALPPEQQQMLLNRQRAWAGLTPEQRRKARQELFPRWRALDPQRRRLLTWKLRELRNLSPEERERRLNDPGFTGNLSDAERSLLRDLVSLGSPGATSSTEQNPSAPVEPPEI